MRKIVFVLSAVILSASGACAQTTVDLVPQAGYSFPATNNFFDTYGRVEGGLNLGGAINFNVNRFFGFEVLYTHTSTTSGTYNYDYNGGDLINSGNLKQDYIMAGPVFSGHIPGTTVRPFMGLLLGAAILTPDAGYQSNTYFAGGIQLGTNIYISPRVGIQLKAQVLSPFGSAGGAYNYNDYYGGGINPNQSAYQFTLGGGLIIGVGRVLPPQVAYFRRYRIYRY